MTLCRSYVGGMRQYVALLNDKFKCKLELVCRVGHIRLHLLNSTSINVF